MHKIPSFTGSTRELVRAPHRFFLQLTREYGDIVQYRAMPEPAYLVNHPDYVKHVLVSNGRNYNKDTHLNKYMLKSVTGQGLLTSENPLWRKQRRLIQPAFHRHNLVTFTDLMCDATNQMLARLEKHAAQGNAMEIMIILPMTLQRFRLQLVPDHPVEAHALVTLRPKHGILMTATRRTN